MLNTITIILGAIATIACIFGYIFALNPDHKYVSLWIYGTAACLYVFAACWGIQASWMESDKTSTPKESLPMNNQTGQGNVNAPNNQGNINTGSVGGNLNQVVNIGSKKRTLSPEQKAILEAAFLQLAGTKRLRVMAVMGDPESGAFAQEIVDCLPPDSRTGLLLGVGKNFPGKVLVCVQNPANRPAFTDDVLNAFRAASIPVIAARDSSGPDANSVWIKVFSNQ